MFVSTHCLLSSRSPAAGPAIWFETRDSSCSPGLYSRRILRSGVELDIYAAVCRCAVYPIHQGGLLVLSPPEGDFHIGDVLGYLYFQSS